MKSEGKNTKSQDSLEEISFLIQKIIKSLQTRGRRALMEEGLTFPQYYALSLLNKGSQYKMSMLKKELAITGAGATGIADRLIKRGLAKRERSNKDRRIVNIKITDKGKKIIKRMIRRRENYLASALKKIDAEKKDSLMKGLEIFVSIIQE